MRATGALPTEQRCKDMNDAQWLWYYINLLLDIEEEKAKNKSYCDYLGNYINPKMAKYVSDKEKHQKHHSILDEIGDDDDNEEEPNKIQHAHTEMIDDNTEIVYHDTAVNDDFEKELQNALKAAGSNTDELVTLPDSTNAGNADESKEDFLSRVIANQGMAGQHVDIPKKPPKVAIPRTDKYNLDAPPETTSFITREELEKNTKVKNKENDVLNNAQKIIKNRNKVQKAANNIDADVPTFSEDDNAIHNIRQMEELEGMFGGDTSLPSDHPISDDMDWFDTDDD